MHVWPEVLHDLMAALFSADTGVPSVRIGIVEGDHICADATAIALILGARWGHDTQLSHTAPAASL